MWYAFLLTAFPRFQTAAAFARAAVVAQNAPEFNASMKKFAAIVDTVRATEPGIPSA